MDSSSFDHFIVWAFYGIISFSIVYSIGILSKLHQSIEKLNTKIAVIIEKTDWHGRLLTIHGQDIEALKRVKSTKLKKKEV